MQNCYHDRIKRDGAIPGNYQADQLQASRQGMKSLETVSVAGSPAAEITTVAGAVMCIKKVWEIDPLLCGNRGGEMKIICFIYKRTVIKEHHGIPESVLGLTVPDGSSGGPVAELYESER